MTPESGRNGGTPGSGGRTPQSERRVAREVRRNLDLSISGPRLYFLMPEERGGWFGRRGCATWVEGGPEVSGRSAGFRGFELALSKVADSLDPGQIFV